MLPIGQDGGIALAPESTWDTAGTVFAWQHAVSSSLGFRSNLLKSERLQRTRPRTEHSVPYGDGDIVVEYSQSLAIIGTLLRMFGVEGTGDVEIDGSAPDLTSATGRVNHGGIMFQYAGLVGASLRLELAMDKAAKATASFVGGTVTKPAAVTPSLPDASTIFMPSDLGAITVGGSPVIIKTASIECKFEVPGADRVGLGASTIMQPYQYRFACTGSLTVELANDTGNDTEDILDTWIAGTALGDISLSGGDFVLGSCYMAGDAPALQPGAQEFPINFDADALLLDNLVT